MHIFVISRYKVRFRTVPCRGFHMRQHKRIALPRALRSVIVRTASTSVQRTVFVPFNYPAPARPPPRARSNGQLPFLSINQHQHARHLARDRGDVPMCDLLYAPTALAACQLDLSHTYISHFSNGQFSFLSINQRQHARHLTRDRRDVCAHAHYYGSCCAIRYMHPLLQQFV